jgi:hypothetical protein
MANLSDKIGPSGVATGDQGVATTDSPAFAGLTVNGQIGLSGSNYGTSGQVLTSNGSGSAPSWGDSAAGGLKLISSTDLANDATCDFIGWGSLGFDYFLIVLGNVVPATDSVGLQLRTTADDSTFDSGASDYDWSYRNAYVNTSTGGSGSTGSSQISISGSVGSAANEEGVSGVLHIPMPHLTKRTHFRWDITIRSAGGTIWATYGGGARLSSAAVTGVRLLFSSGNLESGTINLYGGRNA